LEQGRQLSRIGIEVNAIQGVNAIYVPTKTIDDLVKKELLIKVK
jgi:hypothetical protein